VAVIDQVGRTPREWAPYIEHRARGHNPLIVDAAALTAKFLLLQDRGMQPPAGPLPEWAGARPDQSGPVAGHVTSVASLDALRSAIAAAAPGDTLVLRAGTYTLSRTLPIAGPNGRAGAPITLRAERLGDVVIDSATVEAINLSAAHWHLESLVLRGRCGADSDCEHAIHVVGGATDTVLRNLRLEDFNAQIKINGLDGAYPDGGEIASVTLRDTHPRDTLNPIAPIDLVAAGKWHIHDVLIADFARSTPDGLPGPAVYGAFVKGGGTENRLDHNVVLCEAQLRSLPSPAVGMSLGGGGTGEAYCRGGQGCPFEQRSGHITDNIIASCNDVGIYVNKSAHSDIARNILIDTAGIDVRFPESSAHVVGNLVDGTIRARDQAIVWPDDNTATPLIYLFLGLHPDRTTLADAARRNGWTP